MAACGDMRAACLPARQGEDPRGLPRRRKGTGRTGTGWAAPVLAAAGVLLAAWTGYLAVSLPGRSVSRHYNIAWAGFDVLLVTLILTTAWLVYRRSPRATATAAATAALLIADAWFDVSTAGPGRPLHMAVLLAVVAELPAALFMITTSLRAAKGRSEPPAGAASGHPAGPPAGTTPGDAGRRAA